jgi:hypothetical protein
MPARLLGQHVVVKEIQMEAMIIDQILKILGWTPRAMMRDQFLLRGLAHQRGHLWARGDLIWEMS